MGSRTKLNPLREVAIFSYFWGKSYFLLTCMLRRGMKQIEFLEHDVSIRMQMKHVNLFYIGMRYSNFSKCLSISLHIKLPKRQRKWKLIYFPFVHRDCISSLVRDTIRLYRRMKVREVVISKEFGRNWHLFIWTKREI